LLVVIAIIVILALTAFVVINPLELQRRSRDSVRISDLATINQAITAAVADASQSASSILCGTGCTAGTVYTSLDAGARANDGTGWVKVNLNNQHAVSVAALALDPSNAGNSTLTGCTGAALEYRYASTGSDWELNAALESQQYQNKMNEGGGDNCQF